MRRYFMQYSFETFDYSEVPKLLFLKKLYDLSNERLIASAQTDMAYKYFLGLEPEENLIDPSLLTKFRKTRITEDILEEMLKETITQAIEKGLVKSGTIIVDSTHSDAAVRPKTVTQVLRGLTKKLRRKIYKSAYDMSEKFPEKPSCHGGADVFLDRLCNQSKTTSILQRAHPAEG